MGTTEQFPIHFSTEPLNSIYESSLLQFDLKELTFTLKYKSFLLVCSCIGPIFETKFYLYWPFSYLVWFAILFSIITTTLITIHPRYLMSQQFSTTLLSCNIIFLFVTWIQILSNAAFLLKHLSNNLHHAELGKMHVVREHTALGRREMHFASVCLYFLFTDF